MPPAVGPGLRRYLARCSGSRDPLPGAIDLGDGVDGSNHVRCLCGVVVPARDGAPALLLLRSSEAGFERFSALARSVRDLDAELRERQRSQAVLEEALRDRELMLRELHHRVKNSIQLLTGMVAAARRDAEEPAARAVLDEAGRRLAAMAAVHQMLYRAEQIGGLRADRFMTELAASILRPLGAEGRATVCASPDAAVPNDAAVPRALILNELLANAVKHGPPGGRIRATLAEHGSSFELTVEDEGPGFVPPLSSRRTSGLALVRGLVRQLGGKFAVERREPSGARCVVRVDSRRDAGSEARA